jgi:hypothetical protein
MNFETKQELRDLQAELDRLDTVLRTRRSWAVSAAAHARIRAAFYLGRTTFSSCLNVIVFGGLEELGLLRDAVKDELASVTAYGLMPIGMMMTSDIGALQGPQQEKTHQTKKPLAQDTMVHILSVSLRRIATQTKGERQ